MAAIVTEQEGMKKNDLSTTMQVNKRLKMKTTPLANPRSRYLSYAPVVYAAVDGGHKIK